MSAVFFCQAIVGEHAGDESGANRQALLGKRLSDLISIEIGLEAQADDKRLDFLGAFRWVVRAGPFGQEISWRSVEDGSAAIVIGFACLEAETRGELALGETTEFPEGDHTDLLLHSLSLGEGDGFPRTVCEHERAVLGLNVEVEIDLHGRPLPRSGIDAFRALQICLRNFGQNQETRTGENGQTTSAGLMAINVDVLESCRRWKDLKQRGHNSIYIYNIQSPLGPRHHLAERGHSDY